MTEKEAFTVDQAAADRMYAVIYDQTASTEEIWDAITSVRKDAIEVGINSCNDGSYLGPCGVTHFGTGMVGHLYFSTILDRVQSVLEDPTYDPGSKIAFALDLINEAWETSNNRIGSLTEERESRVGRY